MTLCIIQGLDQFHSSSFVRAHVELLAGEKVALTNYYPELAYQGRQIRYFYSTRPRVKKLCKLLPHWLYRRYITAWEDSFNGRHDAIAGFMQQHKVDVILAEFGVHGATICPHARKLGIPLVVHFHGHDAHREPLLETVKESYQAMFDYAFRLISVSHAMTEALVNMGADETKIVYNPYGPRDCFFEVKPVFSKTFVAIGRFTDIKAPYLTLMAFREVLARHPEARLMMGGDGELLETCRTLVRTWGIEASVEFPGVLRHEQVLELLGRACCFVQHSVRPCYGDAEGTPVAILEAAAAGLPVISTRHAGIVDAVIDGETGFLVDERDVAGMADKMSTLMQDVDLCQSMGAAARQHIAEHYSIDRHIAGINRLVAEARHPTRTNVRFSGS